MKILNPDYITIVVHFKTESIAKDDVTNDFRRSFVNFKAKDKGSPKIRIKAVKIYNDIIKNKGEEFLELESVLIPFHFSLIKERVESRRPAVGVIMIYKYLGVPQFLEDFLGELNSLIKRRFISKKGIFTRCRKYEMFISKEI